ncbi:hypothetical protein DFR86_03250 [Acidianus sulfidivorans JP7]|uniref:Endonuclease n=1 Tax=Acidianus sulfidivorans JP7 TaxID=619593 RepID=A0A2U9IKX8_9CREN|nr:hypothetical protein [Acidianus sulfidivorans]AWR96666.1 hypothetical protein DFR86_03250 [Acidianus sulfidivorans JP7]
METLKELKNEYGLTDEELDFALNRAKGMIFGFAMEYRARKVLEELNFSNIVSVDLPTHDLEAEKDGIKYFIEVKASKKSPTKEYSAYKIAMIAKLNGIHMTLVMIPKPNLMPTEEILSKPKRVLYEFFKLFYNGDTRKLRLFLEDANNKAILLSYDKVISHYIQEIPENTSFEIIRSIL